MRSHLKHIVGCDTEQLEHSIFHWSIIVTCVTNGIIGGIHVKHFIDI